MARVRRPRQTAGAGAGRAAESPAWQRCARRPRTRRSSRMCSPLRPPLGPRRGRLPAAPIRGPRLYQPASSRCAKRRWASLMRDGRLRRWARTAEYRCGRGGDPSPATRPPSQDPLGHSRYGRACEHRQTRSRFASAGYNTVASLQALDRQVVGARVGRFDAAHGQRRPREAWNAQAHPRDPLQWACRLRGPASPAFAGRNRPPACRPWPRCHLRSGNGFPPRRGR
jgi:hypothetical protein